MNTQINNLTIKATSGMIKTEKLIVKKERCPQNHPCPSVKVCPVNALSQEGYDAPKVDMNKCISCSKCIKFCPMNALALE